MIVPSLLILNWDQSIQTPQCKNTQAVDYTLNCGIILCELHQFSWLFKVTAKLTELWGADDRYSPWKKTFQSRWKGGGSWVDNTLSHQTGRHRDELSLLWRLNAQKHIRSTQGHWLRCGNWLNLASLLFFFAIFGWLDAWQMDKLQCILGHRHDKRDRSHCLTECENIRAATFCFLSLNT